MKLASFRHQNAARIGVVTDDGVVDLSQAAPELPGDMLGLLAAGPSALEVVQAAAARATRIPLADVTLDAPVPRPGKFLGVGLNYADHVAEAGIDTPEHPTLFNKQTTCVTATGSPIHLPRASHVLDYEGELAFVVGRRCRHVTRDEAPEVIAGYTIVDDVTVRDWQLRIPTWTIGKSFDTHGPMGPWIVTPDELPDPHQLELRTWVNGELRQESNTKNLIFDCFTLIEHLSTAMTLEPGDVVATGTPGGVGIAMKPPRLLTEGDTVRISIEGIGEIENTVIAEPEATRFIA